MRLILASQSPRRKQILEKHGHQVVVDVSNFDESTVQLEDPTELVMMLAQRKGETVEARHQNEVIVAADTIVYFDGEKIGQQETPEAAFELLKRLCGNTHEVYTGLYVKNTATGELLCASEVSRVRLKSMPDEKIREYVESGQFRGKAGAYNIADPDFETFVEWIDGDYLNILGLPYERLAKMLRVVAR